MSQGILSMGFVLGRAPVIPVLAIDDPATAVPLARALVNGGLPVLEITLRTPQALAAVEAIARAVPEALPGVGTYTQAADAARARDAGARFLVSPGTTQAVMEAAAAVEGAAAAVPRSSATTSAATEGPEPKQNQSQDQGQS